MIRLGIGFDALMGMPAAYIPILVNELNEADQRDASR